MILPISHPIAAIVLALRLAGTGPAARTPLPVVRIALAADPATRTFSCRYRLALLPTDTATTLRLLVPRGLRVQRAAASSQGTVRASRCYYPFLADTVQQLLVHFPHLHRRRQLNLAYTGRLTDKQATPDALEFSGHSQWLPFRASREYELVTYRLDVALPPGWQVCSSVAPRRATTRRVRFAGCTSAIEPTALLARKFQQLATQPGGAAVELLRAAPAMTPADNALLHQAADIVHFYNRSLGRLDSIRRFRLLLPGTNRDAFGLLDNAVVITYADFNPGNRGDQLILAHEISHRWWSYGSVHTEADWLNEAFATYSSLLYLQARGDTAGYRAEYQKRAATVPGTPPIIGFDRFGYDQSMYRRVIYNKGTVVLAALHARVGTAQLYTILAETAAQKVSTTAGLLAVVGQIAGDETRQWLLAELIR